MNDDVRTSRRQILKGLGAVGELTICGTRNGYSPDSRSDLADSSDFER